MFSRAEGQVVLGGPVEVKGLRPGEMCLVVVGGAVEYCDGSAGRNGVATEFRGTGSRLARAG